MSAAASWAVENQYSLHRHDMRWQCGCPFTTGHSIDRNGCTMAGWRHSNPFSQCLECHANLEQNGYSGAGVVRVMRELAEEHAQ